MVLNVAGTIVMARALGPAGRGAVAVAFSFTLLLIQFGHLGLISANPYFAARDPSDLPRIVSNTIWTALGLGLTLALAGLGVRLLFPALLRGLDVLDMGVVLVGIPAALANQLFQSILLAEGRMVAYNGVELGMAVVVFTGLVLGLVVFSFGVLGAIALLVAVNTAGSVCYLALLVRHQPPRRPDLRLMGRMLRYGGRVYLATLLAYLVGRVNLLLVNSYLGGVAAGDYSVALAAAEGMHLLPTVVALNLFPRVARGESSRGGTAAVFRSLALIYGLLCLVTIPLVAPAVSLLVGHAFSGTVAIYYWLLPGIYSYGMVSVLSYHFAGRGFPLGALLVWIPGLLLNFGMVVPLLAAHASVNVAALAASISYSLILILHMKMYAAESGSYRVLVPRPREAWGFISDVMRSLRPVGV